MLRNFLSVGGITLLSRLTGFARDVIMAAVIGAGPLMDAFSTAFRLPNHFRTIFGEGAFSAAYIPAYTQIRVKQGEEAAKAFQGRMLTILLLATGLLTLLALYFTPQVINLLAPGFDRTPERYRLAVALTRITFPYLMLITVVTLWSGALNAAGRFVAAAFAPILLNLSLIAAMYLAGWFDTPGHAAAWAVTASGLLQLVLLGYAAQRAGILALPRWPRRDADLRLFFRRFLPAVIGAAGTQIAMFADTIISTLLPTGAPSSIYYADRIYQLPIGVIAIAAGTVLLPEMSRRFANGDIDGAHSAQNRVVALTALMTLPFAVAFLLLAEPIMLGAFGRGRFDLAAAQAAGGVLAAYGVGLPAIVLIRAAVAGFQARGDTRTPMIVALVAVACNVALKLVLTGPLGTPGLALATSAGAWINLVLLVVLGCRRGWMAPDRALLKRLGAGLAAALALAVATPLLDAPLRALTARLPQFHAESFLMLIGGAGAVIYVVTLLVALRLAGAPLRRR